MNKNDIYTKVKLQDEAAYNAVVNMQAGQRIILYGSDKESLNFLADLYRKRADVVLNTSDKADVCFDLIRSDGNTYLIEDPNGLLDEHAYQLMAKHTVLVLTSKHPSPNVLHGDEVLFEVFSPNHITKLSLMESLCTKYGFKHDASIVASIISTADTVEELRQGIFNRLDREKPKEAHEVCHAFDAPLMRPSFFILWHLLPILVTAILAVLSQMQRCSADLGFGIAVQCITTIFLILTEHGRCQSAFGVIFNSLAGFSIGVMAVLIKFLLT